MLSYVFWNPKVIAFTVLGWPVRWYALCWCAGLLCGYLIVQRLYKRQGIPAEKFDPLFFYVFFGVIIGARLGHCLFYEPGYFLLHPVEMVLPVRHLSDGWHLTGYEGLASHGGVVGMMVAIWLYSRKYRISVMHVLDNVAVAAPLTASLIRLGNLFNSEIVGHATSLPWGFVFAANGETFARHPAQLYESLFYLLFFIVGIAVYRRCKSRVGTGFFFGLCLTVIFTFRFFIEFLKDVQEDFEQSLPLDMGQLLSLPIIAIGIYCLAGGKWCRRLAQTPPDGGKGNGAKKRR